MAAQELEAELQAFDAAPCGDPELDFHANLTRRYGHAVVDAIIGWADETERELGRAKR